MAHFVLESWKDKRKAGNKWDLDMSLGKKQGADHAEHCIAVLLAGKSEFRFVYNVVSCILRKVQMWSLFPTRLWGNSEANNIFWTKMMTMHIKKLGRLVEYFEFTNRILSEYDSFDLQGKEDTSNDFCIWELAILVVWHLMRKITNRTYLLLMKFRK